MSSHFEELDSLLFDWEAETLDANGVERLREILRSDEAARTFFVQQQMIGAALKLDGDAGLRPPGMATSASAALAPNASTDPPRRGAFRMRSWTAVAVAVLIFVLTGRLGYLEFAGDAERSDGIAEINSSTPRDQDEEATSQGVALVTRLVDVVWDADQTPRDIGDALSPGRFAIKSGYAQLEFFCGATIVLEGPAQLDLESATSARVHNGRLRAHVPPAARGFTLAVADMTVVDLGTEFGLSVSPEGANLQVFDGEVELQRRGEQQRHLTAGQALTRSASGSFNQTAVTPDRFLSISDLAGRAQTQQNARYQRWKQSSEELRSDPRLIAYYPFDQEDSWDRTLTCATEPADTDLDGAIVGAREVTGRWPQKRALEFKRPGDRVRVDIPGAFGSLTFACWVKIDSLDRWFNSLFLTDNYNRGEPHWQILDTGQMYFSVRPVEHGERGPRDYKVLSPPFWEASMSGQWLHLATTYDVAAGRATHFLNGDVLHSETIPDAQLVQTTQIGTASIGNWALPTQPDASFAVRNLNGSIDEFAIFGAALTADEIQEMYQNGKP